MPSVEIQIVNFPEIYTEMYQKFALHIVFALISEVLSVGAAILHRVAPLCVILPSSAQASASAGLSLALLSLLNQPATHPVKVSKQLFTAKLKLGEFTMMSQPIILF